ncbi:hypothetical protein TI39_contig4107g00001 [Zymoseptoria brevis]|uniref:Mediator of RNA polymerase II transcription subunit 11 n=1 Tax=Zymoseptoria brevis TaxID=1047168 RepID=A0A0F4GDN1_9PEZI|nr:hypothetical protein TI39_contig4107g00001 [Zymoseptoria brevis]
MALSKNTPTISPEERIRELSTINTDVAALLTSAGHAINSLTNRPLERNTSDEDTEMDDATANCLEDHKKAFAQHTTEFFEGLQGVVARLRRQAYALEEAGIITPDTLGLGSVQAPVVSVQGGRSGAAQQEVENVKNGGLGNFDVGWLNSRGNKVGRDKEKELVIEAKELLEKVVQAAQEQQPRKQNSMKMLDLTGSMRTVVVGQEPQPPFFLHHNILCKSSELFKSKLTWLEAFELPSSNYEAFQLYPSWLYAGCIPQPQDNIYMERITWPLLAHAFALGEAIKDNKFKDLIIDYMQEVMTSNTPGMKYFHRFHASEVVTTIYSSTPRVSPA